MDRFEQTIDAVVVNARFTMRVRYRCNVRTSQSGRTKSPEALTLRPTLSDHCSKHYQVHSGEVRIGTIYHTRTRPDGKEWFWGINGVLHGPLVFNGFAMTLDDARCELALQLGQMACRCTALGA